MLFANFSVDIPATPPLWRLTKYTFVGLMLLGMGACASTGTQTAMRTVNGLNGRMIAVHDYYPVSLRRKGVSGSASLHYSVSAHGIPMRIEVTEANEPAFGTGAIAFLRDWRFEVPANWTADGGPQRRFKMRVQFRLTRSPRVEKWNPDDPLFTITGTR